MEVESTFLNSGFMNFLFFTCGIPWFFGVESMKIIHHLYMLWNHGIHSFKTVEFHCQLWKTFSWGLPLLVPSSSRPPPNCPSPRLPSTRSPLRYHWARPNCPLVARMAHLHARLQWHHRLWSHILNLAQPYPQPRLIYHLGRHHQPLQPPHLPPQPIWFPGPPI